MSSAFASSTDSKMKSNNDNERTVDSVKKKGTSDKNKNRENKASGNSTVIKVKSVIPRRR